MLYGIGPSSLYEVIPGNRVGFAGEWPVTTYRTQDHSTMAASGGNLPVNTVRSQIGG